MFLVEFLEVFFAPFILIYKLFIPDSETGKATIPGYILFRWGLFSAVCFCLAYYGL